MCKPRTPLTAYQKQLHYNGSYNCVGGDVKFCSINQSTHNFHATPQTNLKDGPQTFRIVEILRN